MIYFVFLWFLVVATRHRKTFALAMHNSWTYWLHKNCPYTQDAVMPIRSYYPSNSVKKDFRKRWFC